MQRMCYRNTTTILKHNFHTVSYAKNSETAQPIYSAIKIVISLVNSLYHTQRLLTPDAYIGIQLAAYKDD